MMKFRQLALIPLWIFLLVSYAQSPVRIVVLPFNASGPVEPYALGLAVGLERSLNTLDGVFVIPVGDAFVMSQRLEAENRFDSSNIAQVFNADAIVTGRITPQGGRPNRF
ncbi:MAG: hypothetical protein R2880_03100 [Deinococcales bacterium]